MFDFEAEHTRFVKDIVAKKYLINDEKSYLDVINRIIKQISNRNIIRTSTLSEIYSILAEGYYMTSGSISFGLGNNNVNCSLSNCYFTPIENDSIEGIFEAAKNMARTYSYRGGTGVDITILRPKNAKVNNSALFSTGAVSFMPLFSDVTNIIGQNGRRGACIISLDVRHPDILDFIWCKSDPEKVFGKDLLTNKTFDVTGANITVKLTDDFMNAVDINDTWTLFYPDTSFSKYNTEWDGDYDKWLKNGYPVIDYHTVNAKDLLMQIAQSAHISGDPGVAYWDTVIENTPGSFDLKLKPDGFNPCGEQCLAKFNNCLLGCIVLHKFVSNPYTKDAYFDMNKFLSVVGHGIKLLDAISDINIDKHPLEQQREMDRYGKRLGQEFTGLADCLAMLGMEYGSDESLRFIEELLLNKALTELEQSIILSQEKGAADCFSTIESREKFINMPYFKNLEKFMDLNIGKWSDQILKFINLRDLIIEHGLRNSAFNTVGPTGTISIVSDNCTSGIEPLFAMKYKRATRLDPGKLANFVHYPAIKYGGANPNESVDVLLSTFTYKESKDIPWEDRVKLQATVQMFTDASVSSTINLPNKSTPEDIFKIYRYAWSEDLKGITVFREGCKTGILTSNPDKTDNSADAKDCKELPVKTNYSQLDMIKHLEKIKDELQTTHNAIRFVQKWKNAKIYITVTVDDNKNPLEIFANVPNDAGISDEGIYKPELYLERAGYWNSICRLTSLLLRAGVPIENIVRQLERSSTTLVDLPAIIIRILSSFITDNGEVKQLVESGEIQGEYCYQCKKYGIIRNGGCKTCLKCGESACG